MIIPADQVKPEDVTTLALQYRDGVPFLVASGGDSFPTVIPVVNGSGTILGAYTANQTPSQPRRIVIDTSTRPVSVVSTMAGTGSATWQGDGRPAHAATLYNPPGISVAADGTLHIGNR
ncbi:hypothetical protein ACFWC9_29605 [Streptomyces goshikiensis]|uniref:hypothetical protein n=1 Tax=Streptomyces goshikiensis TaxID=1942 RepID=UPI0036C6FF27